MWLGDTGLHIYIFSYKNMEIISFVILNCCVTAKSEILDLALRDHKIRFLRKISKTQNSDNGEKHKTQSSEHNKIK